MVAHNLSAARRGNKHLRLAAKVGVEGIRQRGVARQLVLAGVECVQAIGIAGKYCIYIHI